MKRAVILALLCGACTTPDISMPDVRGKSCQYYAARIAELTGTVAAKEAEAQAETAGFMAASIGLSVPSADPNQVRTVVALTLNGDFAKHPPFCDVGPTHWHPIPTLALGEVK